MFLLIAPWEDFSFPVHPSPLLKSGAALLLLSGSFYFILRYYSRKIQETAFPPLAVFQAPALFGTSGCGWPRRKIIGRRGMGTPAI